MKIGTKTGIDVLKWFYSQKIQNFAYVSIFFINIILMTSSKIQIAIYRPREVMGP